jgi:5-methylcytosine-specific restriction enzyme subunit McrC
MGNRPRIIELREFVAETVPADALSIEEGERLWREYGNYVAVEFPSLKTGGAWQLTSLGWVGSIPLSDSLRISLLPRVRLSNLFRMLEYAYRLESFHLLEGLIDCESIEDLYERWAAILAGRILDRGRTGLYRSYIPHSDRLPFVRGSLDLKQLMRSPWSVELESHYQEHTSDIEENQILLWTLFVIARQGICSERTGRIVRTAFRSLQGEVTLRPCRPLECVGRVYNRLNIDYEVLHSLCRFFLEQSGPGYREGEWRMIPFLVNMARLYELFVAEWLKQHLPERYRLSAQEEVVLQASGEASINIDLVLYDRERGEPVAVLDTKYKLPDAPAPGDLHQIVAYATARGCRQGALIYPAPLSRPFQGRYGAGDIYLRTLTFALEGELEERGRSFLSQLLPFPEIEPVPLLPDLL